MTSRQTANIDPEEAALVAASDAYHDHPAHPTDCEAYREHAEAMGRNNNRCPCESYVVPAGEDKPDAC